MGRDTKAARDKHYREYGSKPEAIAARSANNKARRIMEKKVGKAAMKGKDVDHIKMQKNGGTNAVSNLRLQSPHINRGRTRG